MTHKHVGRFTPAWLTPARRKLLYRLGVAGGGVASAIGVIQDNLVAAIAGVVAAAFPALAQDNTDTEDPS